MPWLRFARALILTCWLPVAPVSAADGVTIYRCTDARGKVELRDTPCPKGKQQTSRQMVRPVDGPRRLTPVTVTAPAPVAEATRYIVVNPPRPLYECVTPDGARYTSDSPEGNPRWMPLWALDYPVLVERDVYTPGSGGLRIRDGRVDLRYDTGGMQRRVVPTIAAYGAGTWVRDRCYPLPQQEVCARMLDRRDELRRQFFNGQPSERARLEVEERGINARLSSDCGGY